MSFCLRRTQARILAASPALTRSAHGCYGHFMSDSSRPDRRPNRLANETSPYLLQHAYNPVDWYPWGNEALQAAQASHKPILLSIGYSACHWCHVMERESFENEAIAAIMNQHFICIKVDREERPDLDEIYMAATVAMNQGQGGWPMTVFLTPDTQPFFAGTYFPPEDRWGRPGFGSLLKKIAEYWEKDSAACRNQAAQLTERLQGEGRIPSPITVNATALDEAVDQCKEEFDSRYGGFGRAPKFPPATTLSLLLRCYHRTHDAGTLAMVTTTLDMMAAGGIYDHIGGGFARYSTDERWLVPHFEKMLYDNALLARIYVEAYQRTKKPLYRQVATEVLDYILREMTGPEGGFYSATDADSEGVEGKFFVWTPAEVRAAVAHEQDADRFCALYDITESGNWEHRSIPNRLQPIEQVAARLNVTIDELLQTAARVKPVLYQARRTRVPPALDDKIITSWNGMMISAMAEAARVLGEPRYLDAARRTADFLLRQHGRADGRLLRTSRAGRAHLDAYLEDYAFLADGLIDLYEAGADECYLHSAAKLGEYLLSDFAAEGGGGFFTTAKHHELLILRKREGADGAIPSANAVAATALARLSFHFGREEWRTTAAEAIRAYGRQISRYPRAFAKSLIVVDFLMDGPVELALVGDERQEEFQALRQAAADCYLPNRIMATGSPGSRSQLPLLQGKHLVGGRPALYVCRHFTCREPVTDSRLVADALISKAAAASAQEGRLLRGPQFSGHATRQGTAEYAARSITRKGAGAAHGFSILGGTGLTVSRLGFGTYRVSVQEPLHREALRNALLEGINVIDTSTNYMDGDSERLVGAVVRETVERGDLRRDEVVVISKIGYVQGDNLKAANARERSGRPYPDMVKYGDGVWHCIHPEFLEDQLTASLDRLQLTTLDVCLLHNPEYMLAEAARRGELDLHKSRTLFYERLEHAFAFFETQIAAGRMQYYGVSSNTVTAAPDHPEATSLALMVSAAQRASQSVGTRAHHFAIIQCPMNLLESGAVLTPNTGEADRETLVEWAAHAQVAVVVNRPLNAMLGGQGGMMRLAQLPVDDPPIDVAAQRDVVAKFEHEYRQTIAPSIQHSGQGMMPVDFFNWAEELERVRPQVQGLEHWEQLEHHSIAPQINQALQTLSRHLTGPAAEQWESWRDRYIPEFLSLLRGIRREAAERSHARTGKLAAALDPLWPPSRRTQSLARKALWTLASTPGVSCVLTGIRTPPYVEDALAVLEWEPLPDVRGVYEKAKTVGFP